MTTLTCGDCKAELGLSINISLRITYGELCVKCPICGYIQRCRIDNNGKVIFIVRERPRIEGLQKSVEKKEG